MVDLLLKRPKRATGRAVMTSATTAARGNHPMGRKDKAPYRLSPDRQAIAGQPLQLHWIIDIVFIDQ